MHENFVKKRLLPMEKAFNLVEVTRLELTTSWTRTMRATTCATPRRVKKTNFHPLTDILYNKTAEIATKIAPFSEKIFLFIFLSLRRKRKIDSYARIFTLFRRRIVPFRQLVPFSPYVFPRNQIKPSEMRSARSTRSIFSLDKTPIFSLRRRLSKVLSCSKSATEAFLRPDSPSRSSM